MDFKRRVEETRRAFDELLKSSADLLEHYVKISEVQGALELFPTAPEGLLTQTCKSLEQFQRQLDLLTLDLTMLKEQSIKAKQSEPRVKEDVDMTDIALDETSTLDALTAGITNDIVDWNSMDQWLDL